MFNVGGPEILVIILVALVVLGPEQLPKAMRTFGNVMGEIRKVSSGFQDEMRSAMNTAESGGSEDKPQSGANPAALTPEAADVTDKLGGGSTAPAPTSASASDRPNGSAADRAAG